MKLLKTLVAAIIIGVISISTAFAAETKAAGNPGISFPETVYDFGTIHEEAGPVSHTFEFINTGNAPLLILNASASCGCTRPEFPKKPVQSARKDKIKVTYNPAGRPGEFTKTITIRTNAKAKGEKKVVLKIKGTVIPKK